MFRNGDLNKMRTRLRVMENIAQKEIPQIVSDVTENAATEMRRIIETSGTGWVGKWFSATATGRVDTGMMLGNVSTTHTPRSGTWGWALNGGKGEAYYLYQENGFRHYLSGKDVKPMHALLTSYIKAREELIRRLDKLVQ